MNASACTCCRRPTPAHSRASATQARTAGAAGGTACQIAPAMVSASMPAIVIPAARGARKPGAASRSCRLPPSCVVVRG